MADFRSERADFGPKRGDFRSERVDLGLIGLISGLKEPNLGLSGLGGGMYGGTDGRKEIHPCVLQDIGFLGPLPKKGPSNRPTNQKTNGQTKRGVVT